jgi:hypothetical protein
MNLLRSRWKNSKGRKEQNSLRLRPRCKYRNSQKRRTKVNFHIINLEQERKDKAK